MLGGVAVLLLGGGIAYASIPAGGGVIQACYAARPVGGVHAVGIIDPATTASCPKGTLALSWNQNGPQGPTGATGATGPSGAPATSNVMGHITGVSVIGQGFAAGAPVGISAGTNSAVPVEMLTPSAPITASNFDVQLTNLPSPDGAIDVFLEYVTPAGDSNGLGCIVPPGSETCSTPGPLSAIPAGSELYMGVANFAMFIPGSPWTGDILFGYQLTG